MSRRRPGPGVGMLILSLLALALLHSTGCGASRLDTTVRALGSARALQSGVVTSGEAAFDARAQQAVAPCRDGDRPAAECSAEVLALTERYAPLEQATDASAAAIDAATRATSLWAWHVDDGEGDEDEVPVTVTRAVEAMCASLGRLRGAAEAWGAAWLPSLMEVACGR